MKDIHERKKKEWKNQNDEENVVTKSWRKKERKNGKESVLSVLKIHALEKRKNKINQSNEVRTRKKF